MGCNQFSRNIVIVSVVSKLDSKFILQAESVNTMSATSLISLQPSLKITPSKERRCLKIKLVKPFGNFLIDDIAGSDKLCQKMHKIRKYWLFFTALQTNFDCLVHSVCIPNYTIKDGMKIFTIFTAAKSSLSSITFSKAPPYLELSKDKLSDLNKSWTELSSFLGVIEQKNILKKFQDYEVELRSFILLNDKKKSWYARKAVKLLRNFKECASVTIDKILEFINEVEKNKPKFALLANEVNMAGIMTTSQIVHNISNKI